ncbi:MAG: hypothetical protein HRU15_07055, partial [Planctomycetes bacterium]|nr:hypothetical protein [Planctomycetota bacterium]
VVHLVRSLCAEGRASCILGNHEFALVSSIGLPNYGVDSKPDFFAAWCQIYGGFNTLMSYGFHDPRIEDIREEMYDDLVWMYERPWFLEGSEQQHNYFVVHAGLNSRDDFLLQVNSLRHPDGWWNQRDMLPPQIYEHERAHQNPPDLPANLCVVSGHTVQHAVSLSAERILCDTSGGQKGRKLSAVIWPEGRIVSAVNE